MGVVVFFINLLSWILLVGVNVMQLENGNVEDSITTVMFPYMIEYHPIALGILYIIIEKRIRDKYNIRNNKSTKFTIAAWCISSIIFGYLVMKFYVVGIIPRVGDFFPGLEYIMYVFFLSVRFSITVLFGKILLKFINKKIQSRKH